MFTDIDQRPCKTNETSSNQISSSSELEVCIISIPMGAKAVGIVIGCLLVYNVAKDLGNNISNVSLWSKKDKDDQCVIIQLYKYP